MGCGKYTTEYWRDQLDAQVDDASWTPHCLAWIGWESNGCPGALGTRYEVGIFQIDLEDGPAWGGSLDTLHGNFSQSATSQSLARELTSDEEALQVSTGLAYVRHARDYANSNLSAISQSWSDDDVWCLTKLYHALPRLSDQYLTAANTAGSAGSWSDFADYLANVSRDDAAAVNSAVAAKYYGYKGDGGFSHFTKNAEQVGYADGGGAGFVSAETIVVLAVLAAIACFLSQHA